LRFVVFHASFGSNNQRFHPLEFKRNTVRSVDRLVSGVKKLKNIARNPALNLETLNRLIMPLPKNAGRFVPECITWASSASKNYTPHVIVVFVIG
jgi:hypothetical protein